MSAVGDPGRARAQDLRAWRRQFGDSCAIGEVEPRRSCVCVGVVRVVRLVPGRSLEITIEDGTGRLTAVFTGRTRLPGLEMGGGLRVRGTVADDDQGRKVMRNPDWSLVSEPYA
ncbi:MAG TPA: hypothetical protein VNU01_07250 [Egibacteraceae bacterium]|nr:hypothetical protein [Egibacteraceae bacterium]